jgi:hypothetical protein
VASWRRFQLMEPARDLTPRATAGRPDVPVAEWQRKLVRERLAAHERGEGGTVPWCIVSQEAEELLAKARPRARRAAYT